ncbi:MAG: LacI family DNA-binding transcriptional regulator [Actinomycetota bacterium]|nr:LacI family DNA-binding transcriptional regulator [Actinomycetota bacterium]
MSAIPVLIHSKGTVSRENVLSGGSRWDRAPGDGRYNFHNTLREVAALAGVSVNTVSNVVNGCIHVSAAMRERVEAANSRSWTDGRTSRRATCAGDAPASSPWESRRSTTTTTPSWRGTSRSRRAPSPHRARRLHVRLA